MTHPAGSPGQPLADQPTVAVPLDRYAVPYDAPAQPGDDDRYDDGDEDEDPAWSPGTAPVAVRRADTLAGLPLLLAGMAAGVSLLVVWVNGGATGLELVRDGLADAGSWQPLAVVGGGVVLFLLGLLMYAPARTHRMLGVLALLVSMVVGAGVLVPLAELDWDLDRLAVGAWFTVAVCGLGLVGALKALSTGPRCRGARGVPAEGPVTTPSTPRWSPRSPSVARQP